MSDPLVPLSATELRLLRTVYPTPWTFEWNRTWGRVLDHDLHDVVTIGNIGSDGTEPEDPVNETHRALGETIVASVNAAADHAVLLEALGDVYRDMALRTHESLNRAMGRAAIVLYKFGRDPAGEVPGG